MKPMPVLNLESIAARAREEIHAAFDEKTVFLHPSERAFAQQTIAEGRGPAEVLALVQLAEALKTALLGVLPHSIIHVQALHEVGQAADQRVRQAPSDETRAAAEKAWAAWVVASDELADAGAEVETLIAGTRLAAELRVWKTPEGWWTVREERRDEKGRRCSDFLGVWEDETTARYARRQRLLGGKLPPNDAEAKPDYVISKDIHLAECPPERRGREIDRVHAELLREADACAMAVLSVHIKESPLSAKVMLRGKLYDR